MQLTERLVKTIAATKDRRIIADGTGLVLIVQPQRTDGKPSAKTYAWRGRIKGKIKKINIGRIETMTLASARMKAVTIGSQVRIGENPHKETARKANRKSMSVSEAFAFYMAQDGGLKRSAGEKWRMFRKDVEPEIGRTTITEVETDDLVILLNAIARRAPCTGINTHSLLSKFFRWSASSRARLETGLTSNPMVGVDKPANRPKPRDRYLSETEMKWLLQACAILRTQPRKKGAPEPVAVRKWAIAIELLIRTGQRRSDIIDLLETEIENGLITIPAARFKTDREQVLPIPRQVKLLIDGVARPVKEDPRIFQRMGGQPDRYINRLRAKMEELAGQSIKHWTIHSLRKSVDTHLRDAWNEETDAPVADAAVIEAILGHVENGVSRHYNFSRMIRRKTAVLGWWNDWLDNIAGRTSQPADE